MSIKDTLKFEKENMPDFMWKHEKFLLGFLSVWLGGALVTLVVSLCIGFCVTDEGIYPFIPLIVWASALAVMLPLFVAFNKKVGKKAQAYYTELLSKSYFDTVYSEENLLIDCKITPDGFVLDLDDGEMLVPFEDGGVMFHAQIWAGKIYVNFLVKHNGAALPLGDDNDLYNYLKKYRQLIANKKVFDIFCDDREKFVELLLRHANVVNIEKKLQN